MLSFSAPSPALRQRLASAPSLQNIGGFADSRKGAELSHGLGTRERIARPPSLSCGKFAISAQRLSEHSPATYCRSHARERHLDQSRSAARTPPRCQVSVSLEENSSTKRGTEEAAPGPAWAKLQSCRAPFISPRTHLLIRLPSWPACSRQPTLPFRCLGRKWK